MHKPVNWQDFGFYDCGWGASSRQLPKDFVHVTSIQEGCYDWTILHAFWSPVRRRYYWHGSAGCSCNSWADDIDTLSDFQDGDKEALMRGIRAFCETYRYSTTPSDLVDAIDAVRAFNPDEKE